MPEELTITKFIFDDWWTGTYVDRLTPLLPQEIQSLVDHHWGELQAAAVRQSLREAKKEDEKEYVKVGYIDDPPEGCTCNTPNGVSHWYHSIHCPIYQQGQNLTNSAK